jgi:hypothetical protein
VLGAGSLGQVAVGSAPTESKISCFVDTEVVSAALSSGVNNLAWSGVPVDAEVVIGILTQAQATTPTVQAISYGYTTTGPVVFTKPAGTVTGSLLLCFVEATVGGTITAPADTVPWNYVAPSAGSQTALFWKQAGASEPSTYTFTNGSALANNGGYMLRVEGHNTSTPVQASDNFLTGGGTNAPASPTLTSVNANSLYISALHENNGSSAISTQPASMTLDDIDNGLVTGPPHAMAYQVVASGATGSKTWTTTGTQTWGVFSIIINPGATPVTPSAAMLAGFTQQYTTTFGTNARFTVLKRKFVTGDPAATFALQDNQGGGNFLYLTYAVVNSTGVATPNSAARTQAPTAPALVGTVTRVNSSGATTPYNAAYGQSPTAGNKLILVVVARNTSNPATITTPAGWNLINSGNASVGLGEQNRISVFYRDAVGGDAVPSIAFSGSTSSATIEEWTNLAAGAPDVSGNTNNTASSATMTVPLTTTNAADWIFAAAANTNITATTWTWGGGQVADYAYNYNGTQFIGMGTSAQSVSTTGSYSPSLAYVSSSTVGTMVAVAFKRTNPATTATVTATPSGISEALGVTILAGQTVDVNQTSPNFTTNAPGYELLADLALDNASRRSVYMVAAWAKRSGTTSTEAFTAGESVASSDAWTTLAFTSGSTTFVRNISVTTTSTPAITATASYIRSLSVTTTSTPTITRAAAFVRTIAVTTTSTLQILRSLIYPRTVSVTTTSTPTITRIQAVLRSLSVTTTSTPTITRIQAVLRSLSVTTTSTPTITSAITFARSLAVTTTSTPTITRAAAFVRSISITTTSTPTITRAVSYLRTISITTTSSPTITRAVSYIRSLAVTTTSTPTISRAVAYIRSLAVTTTSTPTITRRGAYARTVSVTTTSTPTITRAISFLRTVAVTTTSSPTISRAASYLRSIAVTTTSTPTITRRSAFIRSLSITTTSTPTISRAVAYVRSLAVTTTSTPAITRAVAYVRSLSVTTTSTPTISQVAAYIRSLAVTTTSTPTISRIQALARSLAVTTTSTPTITRVQALARSLSVTTTSVPTIQRIQAAARTLSVTTTSSPTISRAATYYRTLSVTTTSTMEIAFLWIRTIGAVIPRIIIVDGRPAIRIAGKYYKLL